MLARCGLFLAVALVAALSACQRGDPHAVPIDARTPQRLASWRENFFERLSRDEWREFEAALQELRLRVTAEHEASGSAAVEEAMCRRVDGRTWREVLVLGYEAKLTRLDPARVESKRALDTNALLVSKPGDGASARYLDGLRERQEERVRKIDDEIDAAEKRLVALAGASWSPKLAERRKTRAGPISPPAMPPEQARAEINSFIAEQRAGALMKYGAWPARIVSDAALLPEPERSDFQTRRAAAATSGNTVVAVRVRDRWWIYDERPELPTFSRAVTANLSELDRLNIEATWASWQAELWARRMADENK